MLDGADCEEFLPSRPRSNDASANSPHDAAIARSVRRASELIRFGFVGKAAKTLTSQPPLRATDSLKQQLSELHPPSGTAVIASSRRCAYRRGTHCLGQGLARVRTKRPGSWTERMDCRAAVLPYVGRRHAHRDQPHR